MCETTHPNVSFHVHINQPVDILNGAILQERKMDQTSIVDQDVNRADLSIDSIHQGSDLIIRRYIRSERISRNVFPAQLFTGLLGQFQVHVHYDYVAALISQLNGHLPSKASGTTGYLREHEQNKLKKIICLLANYHPTVYQHKLACHVFQLVRKHHTEGALKQNRHTN